MLRHLRRWGAVYVLVVLFLGSWLGQLLAMRSVIAEQGMQEFWSATFENWQSEWLQLIFQALLLQALQHVMFKAGAEDLERIEGKIDELRAARDV